MNISIPANFLGRLFNKVFTTSLGLFFVFIGVEAVSSSWEGVQKAREMQAWKQTSCTIISSEMKEKGENFRLTILYRYDVNEKVYTSNRYGKKPYYSAETIKEIDAVQKKLSKGKTVPCFYNPTHPSKAILKQPSVKKAVGFLFFSLIFPLVGIFLVILPWISAFKKRKQKERPIEKQKEKKPSNSKYIIIVVGFIFVGVGSLIFVSNSLPAFQKKFASKSWVQVQATVILSKVKSHTDDDGTTYRPYIAYTYRFNGKKYRGDQYSFFSVSSSGREKKAQIVKQYPKGRTFTLYIDPKNPSESVINRTASTGEELLVGIFPLIFVFVGLFVVFAGFRQKKQQLNPEQSRHQTVVLKGSSPFVKAIAFLSFTLIWCSIVYFIIQSGEILFAFIFGFVALILIAISIYMILALFNPRPVVEISPGDIHQGTSVNLHWRIYGRVDRIEKLTISLKCLQISTETSGSGKNKSTRIVKTPLFDEELFVTDQQNEIVKDQLSFKIPEDQPSSVPGNNEGIQWQLLFHGDISRWPDLKQEFPFIVY